MHVLIAALHRPIKPTGVCRHAVNLARCLAETEEVTKISLIIGSWQEDYFTTAFPLTSEKIQLIKIDFKNSSLERNKWFLLGLPIIANKLNPNIVHLSFPIPFLRAKFNAPVVTTIHDLYPYECPENFGFPQAWFNRLFLRQCISNSDGLACVSQVTLKQLNFYFSRLKSQQKLAVIYNYVDFDKVEPQPIQELAENQVFLLSVAQHRQNKNLDLLIKAYTKLLTTEEIQANCQLVIVGSSGPETTNIQNLIAELNLKNKVILRSAITDRELSWLYQNCQAFIIPSSTEGFCLPLAEALSFSDRVICSNIPIFQEVGTSKCTYFSLEGDAVNNLVRAIMQSFSQSHHDNSSQTNLFKKSNIARQYLAFYNEVQLS
jgi:glycosyltransferase involved in cell wall biosynthesis